MKRPNLSRRQFLALTVAASTFAPAQTFGAHASVAEIERQQILDSAKRALSATVQDDTLRNFCRSIAALIAAFVLTKDASYANLAGKRLLHFVESAAFQQVSQPLQQEEDLLSFLPLADLARALLFFSDDADAAVLRGRDQAVAMLGKFLATLNSNSILQLARDRKDHRASAWLLLAAACARASRDEAQLDQLRLRFKRPTIRNQIAADGRFPQEVATENPYRNSLFNFDLLAGACQLLTSPYDNLWNFEMPDGPGMRSVAAYLFPAIRDRAKWSFPADATRFRDLPGRRPALLFAGRAYDRPEYVELFRSAPATPPPDDIAYSFPITQPLLWTTRTPHGL